MEPTWAFPRGHAMVSLVVYGMLAYLLITSLRSSALRLLTIAVAGSLIISIGASRLYLGVHYFADVLAGYAAGAVWLTACVTGLEVARRGEAKEARAS